MKAKRILSLLLAVSLVLTCAVAGIVLPAAAEGTEPADLFNGLGSFEGDTWKTMFTDIGNSSAVVTDPTNESNKVLQLGILNEETGEYAGGGGYFNLNKLYNAETDTYNAKIDITKAYIISFKVYGAPAGLFAYHAAWDNDAMPDVAFSGNWAKAGDNSSAWKTCSYVFYFSRTEPNVSYAISLEKGTTNEPFTKANADYKKTATYIDDITITEAKSTSMLLDTTSATVKPGETLQLAATLFPKNSTHDALVWTSSNAAVATVDSNGLVTAKKNGTANITVTAGALTATCALTVTDNLFLAGDFEGASIITGGDTSESFAVQEGVGYDGSKGLTLFGTAKAGSGPYFKMGGFTWEPNTTYYFDYMIKGAVESSAVQVYPASDFSDVTISYGYTSQAGDDWTSFRSIITTGDNPKMRDANYALALVKRTHKVTTTNDNGEEVKEDKVVETDMYVDNISIRKATDNLWVAGECDAIPGYLGLFSNNNELKVTTEADGNKVLEFTGATTTDRWAQSFPITTDTDFTFRFRAKGAAMQMELYNVADTSATKGWKTIPASDDWKEYTFYFTTNSKSSQQSYTLHFKRANSTDASTYIDDISLTRTQYATDIALDTSELSMKVNDTATVAASSVPDGSYLADTVVWSSDNTAVATVDQSGVITAKGYGTATITATAGTFTATLTVAVPWPTEHFADGSLDTSTDEFNFGTDSHVSQNLSFEAGIGVGGTTAIKINTPSSGYGYYFKGQQYALRPNSLYKVSVMAKTAGTKGSLLFGVSTKSDILLTNDHIFGVKDEWRECTFWMQTGDAPSIDKNWGLYFDPRNFDGDLYLDNFSMTLVEDAKSYVFVNTSSSTTINLKGSNNEDLQFVDSVAKGTVVKLEVIPNGGTLLMPGNLTYTDLETGKVYKVLNKKASGYSEATFGTGTGHQFEFTKPSDGPGYFTAVSTAKGNDDFKMNTAGTALRYTGTEGEYDGIRFLTRLTMTNTFNPDGTLTLTKDDTAYTVVEFGTKLKRKDAADWNDAWTTVAYKQGEVDTMKLLDYCKGASWCPSYIDFAVTMKKGDNVSTEAFEAREYTACGYLVLQDAEGNQTTVYSESELTNSVANAKAAVEAAN